MGQRFNKFFIENKWFIAFYILWIFIHIILFMNGNDERYFWPFADEPSNIEIDDYGFIEFFVYSVLPLIIFVINKLVGKEIKEIIKKLKN